MTTFTLSVSEPLAARIAALLETAPAERIEEAAYAFVEILETDQNVFVEEPSDQETLDRLKLAAEQVRRGEYVTQEEHDLRMKAALVAARQRQAERKQQTPKMNKAA